MQGTLPSIRNNQTLAQQHRNAAGFGGGDGPDGRLGAITVKNRRFFVPRSVETWLMVPSVVGMPENDLRFDPDQVLPLHDASCLHGEDEIVPGRRCVPNVKGGAV